MQLDDWLTRECMSNGEAARRVKTNVSTISRLRRKLTRPTERVARALIKLTHGEVTWEDLYSGARSKAA